MMKIKSNTFSPFTNLAIVISFLFDILYFKRIMVWSDYFGTALIIICTIILTFLANDDKSSDATDLDQQNSFHLSRYSIFGAMMRMGSNNRSQQKI